MDGLLEHRFRCRERGLCTVGVTAGRFSLECRVFLNKKTYSRGWSLCRARARRLRPVFFFVCRLVQAETQLIREL